MSSIDAKFNSEIFRKNQPMIIAADRQLAVLLPVRLAYSSAGYKAGTVLARNTTSGYYQAYDDAASSGLNTARGVLLEEHPTDDFESSTGTVAAVCIFAGLVFKDNLTGLDSNGETDLSAKTIVDATGTNLLKF
jgi:hypothetical protein